MIPYLAVAIGSALGGLLRFSLGQLSPQIGSTLPWTTILINVIGSCVIGFFGTLTMPGSRYAVPDTVRIFVMVGICGGFTTFSSFSLETFNLLRDGQWGRALLNVGLSLVLCLGSVALGHYLAQRGNAVAEITQNQHEEAMV